MRLTSPRVIVGNRGDLLSRFGILHTLHTLGLQPSVFCREDRDIGGLPLPTLRYGWLYNLVPTLRGLRELWRVDRVIWTGGLDLQDDSSLLKLVHLWFIFLSYRLLGLRILVAMQGAGPLTTRPGRWLARRILNLVDGFVARDSGTMELLTGLGTRTRLIRGHDGIFLPGVETASIEPEEHRAIEAMTRRPAGQPLVGFNLRLWFHFQGSILPYQFAKSRYQKRSIEPMQRFVEAAIAAVRGMRQQWNARIVLLSMYEPGVQPWEDDLPYLRQIKEAFAGDEQVVLVDAPLGLGAFCNLMGQLDLMIGTRLHSTLTAMRLGVPAINLSYTNKCRDIFRDMGVVENSLDLESFIAHPDAAVARAGFLLQDRIGRERLRRVVASRIEENAALLRELVQPSFLPHASAAA